MEQLTFYVLSLVLINKESVPTDNVFEQVNKPRWLPHEMETCILLYLHRTEAEPCIDTNSI
jgi:tryptophan-rich sensory protein